MHSLGPSGCGKTTLLNTLAGEVSSTKTISRAGTIYTRPPFNPIHIEQEDLLFAQLTASETLGTSYALNVEQEQRRVSPAAKRATVATLINNLGLKKVADTKVGDARTRGLSGGEKKRLSIGNEIIGNTATGAYIFADEPTSGDATYAVDLLYSMLCHAHTVYWSKQASVS